MHHGASIMLHSRRHGLRLREEDMRTTLDVDPQLLEEAERITGEISASKVVNTALRELIRRQKLKELRELLGTMKLEDNWRELEEQELEEMRRNQL